MCEKLKLPENLYILRNANKPSYPIMEKVLEKSEFIYSMGYNTAIKKDED